MVIVLFFFIQFFSGKFSVVQRLFCPATDLAVQCFLGSPPSL